jgi:hypothetical protein
MAVTVTVAWISQYLAWLRPCQWSIQVSDIFSCATARSEQVKPRASLSSVLKKNKSAHKIGNFTINNGKLLTPNFRKKDQEGKESNLLSK